MGQSTKRKKKAAVRMLERVVKHASRPPQAGMSAVAAGRSVSDLQQYLRKLKRLVGDDPDNEFWDTTQRAVVKVLRYLSVRLN
jgi:hypothetical protein